MTRRECGLRAAETRKQSDDRLRYELETHNAHTLALFEANKHRVPLYPAGQSRLEWFLEFVEERGDSEVWDAMQAKADRDVALLIAAFERATC
jgi:hypothetical protein